MPTRPGTGRTTRGPFQTTLFRYAGKGAWYFAIIPKSVAPPATRPWGRTPVTATVDDVTWETSYGLPGVVFDPASKGAQSFIEFAQEMVNRLATK